MGSLFKPRKQTIVNEQSAANIDLQKAALAKLTDNPAFQYQSGNLDKINSGNYGALSSVQALQNEGAKALRANRYNYTRGAAAFNNNSNIQDAIRAKQNNTINEDIAMAIPGVINNDAGQATQTVQNAYGNQAAGYSDAAKTSLEAYKTIYKPSIFSTVLGAAAPFLNVIPGVGPILAAGAGAVAGATGGGGGQSGSGAGLGSFNYRPTLFGNGVGTTDPSTGKANVPDPSDVAGEWNSIVNSNKNTASNATDAVNQSLTNSAAGTGNAVQQTQNPFAKFNSELLNGFKL